MEANGICLDTKPVAMYAREEGRNMKNGASYQMPMPPRLRRAIRREMFERDISQRELASRTGLAESTICNLLGDSPGDVKLSTIEAVARALGCELDIELKGLGPPI